MPPEKDSLVPHHDQLWKALNWLVEQGRDDTAVVEEACRRYDPSPLDEEFLLKLWRDRSGAPGAPGRRPAPGSKR